MEPKALVMRKNKYMIKLLVLSKRLKLWKIKLKRNAMNYYKSIAIKT